MRIGGKALQLDAQSLIQRHQLGLLHPRDQQDFGVVDDAVQHAVVLDLPRTSDDFRVRPKRHVPDLKAQNLLIDFQHIVPCDGLGACRGIRFAVRGFVQHEPCDHLSNVARPRHGGAAIEHLFRENDRLAVQRADEKFVRLHRAELEPVARVADRRADDRVIPVTGRPQNVLLPRLCKTVLVGLQVFRIVDAVQKPRAFLRDRRAAAIAVHAVRGQKNIMRGMLQKLFRALLKRFGRIDHEVDDRIESFFQQRIQKRIVLGVALPV